MIFYIILYYLEASISWSKSKIRMYLNRNDFSDKNFMKYAKLYRTLQLLGTRCTQSIQDWSTYGLEVSISKSKSEQ